MYCVPLFSNNWTDLLQSLKRTLGVSWGIVSLDPLRTFCLQQFSVWKLGMVSLNLLTSGKHCYSNIMMIFKLSLSCFLLQVAHFYNTIDQQMIPSQQSMMLDSALGFERLVKSPKTGSKESGGKTQVTWDNPLELEAYIDKLQAAADKLTSENRRLRKCHYNISDKV